MRIINFIAMGASLFLCGCIQGEVNDVTPQGTIALERITVGMPESVLKEAMVSFVRDPSAAANAGGKAQYLSREKTTGGGQYIVQCKDGTIFQISELYAETSVTKELAELEMKKLLPKDAPGQSRVEDKDQSQIYYYGNDLIGQVLLTKSSAGQAAKVLQITVTNNGLATKAEQATLQEKKALKPLMNSSQETRVNK